MIPIESLIKESKEIVPWKYIQNEPMISNAINFLKNMKMGEKFVEQKLQATKRNGYIRINNDAFK